MRNLVSGLILAVLLVAPFAATAQDAEAPTRRVDPAAQKLIDGAQGKMHSNKAAGLESFAGTVTIKSMQGTLVCKTEWTEKGGTKVTVTSVPEAMEPMKEMIASQLKPQIENLVIHRSCREELSSTAKCHVEMKKDSTSTVVCRGFEGDVAGRTFEIVFGENGLPKEFHQQIQGMNMVIALRYAEKDGKFLLSGWDIDTPMGVQKMDWTYEKKGAFWIATKVEVSSAMGGSSTVEVSDLVLNGEAASGVEKKAQRCPDCDGSGKCGQECPPADDEGEKGNGDDGCGDCGDDEKDGGCGHGKKDGKKCGGCGGGKKDG
jgi:hypothetical protein